MPSSRASTCVAACARGFAVDAVGGRVEREAETLQAADEMVFDVIAPSSAISACQLVFVSHALHQRAGPAIDEALRQAFVQRVGETVFDGPRPLLPVVGVLQPVGTVGNERPGADVSDAICERIDIAVGAIGQSHLLGKPVLRNAAVPRRHKLVERGDQLGVVLARDLAVVGDLADVPQLGDGSRRGGDGPRPRDRR